MVADAFTLVSWAFVSSLFILFVLLLRRTGLMSGLSRTLSYALWLPVLLRLLIPVQMLSLPIYPHLPESGIVETVTVPERGSTYDGTLAVSPNQGAPLLNARPSTPAGTENGDSDLSGDGGTVPAETRLSRAELALLVWKGGAAALAAIIAATNLSFSARLRRRRVLLEAAGASLPVYTVAGLSSPCLAGLFRPAIYLSPEDAQAPLHLRHIVAHEETHRQNGDPVWSLLRAAALCLHWYNPLVWYAAALSKRDAELACDERTLRRLGGEERAAYGETLLSLTMAKANAGVLLSCSTQMVGGKRTLRERIEGIAHDRRTRATAAFAVIAVLALALVFAFGKQSETTDDYADFLQRVEAAERIAYHPPAYSSTYYPALTDIEIVAEAKEFLLQVERADESDVPEGELNIMVASGFSLDGEYRYYLLNVDGVTLLYQHKPDAEGIKDSDFTLIGKYTDFPIASRLSELAGAQEERNAAIEANALYFLTRLQADDISSAVLTVDQAETALEDALRDDIFDSLYAIAREALFHEVTDEGVLRNYPVYDFSVTLTLADGVQLVLYPIFTQRGSVLMSLVSETENRRFVLDNADVIYRELLYAAGVGDAMGEQHEKSYEQASVSGSETDLEAVARSIGEQIAASWLAVSDETVWKPVDAYLDSEAVFDIYYGENGVGKNFCADVSWKLKFDSRFSMNYWEVGAGLFGPDENGYYSFGLQCLFHIGDDGRWHIAEYGSGGYWADLGFRLDVADCGSLVKAFFLTAGQTHDYRIPYHFCDLPARERAKLSTILDGYTTMQASDFLRTVADHLAQYPNYHELTAEKLYAELPDKYKDFAPILAAEPFWTGEVDGGRFALYDYGKREWALVYETGDVREIAATYFRNGSDPNDSITAFVMDDLLGFSGVAVQSDAVSSHKSYDYYARTDYGVQYVACSFGFYDDPRKEVVSVDLDGDGRSELLVNNIYGADGAERVTVYRWSGSESEVGSPDWSRVGVTLDGIGATNYQERYDAARGVVTLSYQKDGAIKTAELPLAPESFMWLVIDEP